MRLLDTTTRKLKEFINNKTIPLYAILSHTWDEHEIAFQDIIGADPETKAGYKKVENTCSRAKSDGFDYVWIDTCCIDKTSSSELSEAINSMYRWYKDAVVCYVYLSDMPPNTVNCQIGDLGLEFSKSKWFTRGWTLQELIAPSLVIFLNQTWQEIGTRSSLHLEISKISRIPTDVILGQRSVSSASIAQRMSWASARETTRDEDLAYCLMGMFGINMPLLYGEGEQTFTRLQEEIIKISDDYSLFAWRAEKNFDGGLLAPSPAFFSGSSNIIPVDLSGAITVNNKGIHLNVQKEINFADIGLAILPCTQEGKRVAIFLEPVSETNEYFIRVNYYNLEILEDDNLAEFCEKSICVPHMRQIRNRSTLVRAAEVGHGAAVKLLLERGAVMEAQDDFGQVPLVVAAENGHEAVVKLLLNKGANIEAPKYWSTPLECAVRNGHEAVIKLLLANGANIEAGSDWGKTPLFVAAENGHEAVVKLLLNKCANIEAPSYWRSPLMCAAMNGHEAVVKLLLQKGANNDGRGALELSAKNGHEAVTKLLQEWSSSHKVESF